MPEKAQMNSTNFSSFAGLIMSNEEMAKMSKEEMAEMKGVQKGKMWEIPRQVTSDLWAGEEQSLPAPTPTSAQCWGLPAEEGMAWWPMGCSGQTGHPGFSGGARENGCWLGTTVAGWHNGPSRHQSSTEEFGSHPSAKGQKEAKNLPFKLISEDTATQILKSKS